MLIPRLIPTYFLPSMAEINFLRFNVEPGVLVFVFVNVCHSCRNNAAVDNVDSVQHSYWEILDSIAGIAAGPAG